MVPPRRRPRNALFAQWLREWRDEAGGGAARAAYERALWALGRFPLPLPSGAAAAVLVGFGPSICARLDRRLRQHQLGLPLTPPRRNRRPRAAPPPPDETTPPLCLAPTPPSEATPIHSEATPPTLEPDECPSPILFELHPGQFDIILCVDTAETAVWPLLRGGPSPAVLRRLPVGDFLWVAREKGPPAGPSPRELVLDVVVERKAAPDLGQSLRGGRYREQKFRLRRCGLRQVLFLLEAPEGREERLPLPLRTLRQAGTNTQVQDGFVVKWTGGVQDTAAFLQILGRQLRRRYEGRVLRAWGGAVTARGPPEPPDTPCALLTPLSLSGGGAKTRPQTVGDVWVRQLLQVGGLGGSAAAAIVGRFPTPASLVAALSDPKTREELQCLPWGPRGRKLGPSLSSALARLYGTAGPLP